MNFLRLVRENKDRIQRTNGNQAISEEQKSLPPQLFPDIDLW
jgi:hypothetical protein